MNDLYGLAETMNEQCLNKDARGWRKWTEDNLEYCLNNNEENNKEYAHCESYYGGRGEYSYYICSSCEAALQKLSTNQRNIDMKKNIRELRKEVSEMRNEIRLLTQQISELIKR